MACSLQMLTLVVSVVSPVADALADVLKLLGMCVWRSFSRQVTGR